MNLLTFTDFAATLLAQLELPLPDPPQQDTRLAELGFDSVMLVAALGVMDEMGALVDDQALVQAHTLGDLYHLYAVGVAAADDDPVLAP
jgi:acyl carrier protein